MTDQTTAMYAIARGRVQGVGFREYVESRARALRITGYVRNREDMRSVEVVAEGPRSTLEQLIEYIRSGPRMSRVDAVDVNWRAPTGGFADFRTRF